MSKKQIICQVIFILPVNKNFEQFVSGMLTLIAGDFICCIDNVAKTHSRIKKLLTFC